jgi:hypothetical protein
MRPSKFERFALRKFGIVHDVEGKLERPVVAEELLKKETRNKRAFALTRGASALLHP